MTAGDMPVVVCSERRLEQGRRPSRGTSTRVVRTMFFLYSVLIVGGIVFFVTVGLTQQ